MHNNTLFQEPASCVTENLKCVFANSCVLPTVEGVISNCAFDVSKRCNAVLFKLQC